MNKKVLTIILDGLWYLKEVKWNAVAQAQKPFLDKIWNQNPTILINSSWSACGLPEWEIWTSESGHITIWAWKIVWQPLEEINNSIKYWDFFKKEKLLEYFNENKSLHLIWMLSDWWAHSHINHLFALLSIAKEKKVKKVYIHAIADWRDSEMASVEKYLLMLQKKIKEIWVWKISSLIWRFYAMDRDNNLERTGIAFNLLTKWEGFEYKNLPSKVSEVAYEKEKNDYYIKAIKFLDYQKIDKDDDIIFFNFRADRSIQLTKKFFENWYKNLLAFGPYTTDYPVLFPPQKVKNNISTILAKNWKTQLRIAETEKYPHVTFYLNSQNHKKNKWENHILIKSPKIPNYADKPEMSLFELKDKLIHEIKTTKYDCVFVNIANPDLVWHSWILEAGIKAIEAVDKALSEIIPIAIENNYDIIITADHWNVEKMINEKSQKCALHTTNPVRFTLISKENIELKWDLKGKFPSVTNYWLRDIAPTILDLMWIWKDKDMTWESLIK